MKIHHLNCGTFKPLGAQRLLHAHELVTHCLLVEASDCLVLVDAGFGTDDIAHPLRRLGTNGLILKPQLLNSETALYQIRSLGFDPKDVRHILLTHMDLDHVGGIADFPQAKIHIFKTEFENASGEQKTFSLHKQRYHPIQWSHDPLWEIYGVQGDSWNGFEAVRQLRGLPPEILMVPLRGHSKGHCGVAVQKKEGWLLHAGDAYFSATEIQTGRSPMALEIFETLLADDNDARVTNLKRLSQIAKDPNLKVEVFCSHDHSEFMKLYSPF